MNGVILYRGPSLLDGRKIIVVATGLTRRTHNHKTGAMLQTRIIPDGNLDPVQSWRRGRGSSVCGDCPHRDGTCYVNLTQAPLAVWRALRAGAYPRYDRARHARYFRGRFVRFGSYGDPAAVPLRIWHRLSRLAVGHTGYTHQWRTCNPALRRYCMASCDTAAERSAALAMGWRTFRVRTPSEPLAPGEFVCPASEGAGRRLTCAECGACSGSLSGGANATPVIVFHGPAIAGNYRLRRFQSIQAARPGALPLMLV